MGGINDHLVLQRGQMAETLKISICRALEIPGVSMVFRPSAAANVEECRNDTDIIGIGRGIHSGNF